MIYRRLLQTILTIIYIIVLIKLFQIYASFVMAGYMLYQSVLLFVLLGSSIPFVLLLSKINKIKD